MWHIFHSWPLEGSAVQVGPRLTWPLPWSQVATLLEEAGFPGAVIEALFRQMAPRWTPKAGQRGHVKRGFYGAEEVPLGLLKECTGSGWCDPTPEAEVLFKAQEEAPGLHGCMAFAVHPHRGVQFYSEEAFADGSLTRDYKWTTYMLQGVLAKDTGVWLALQEAWRSTLMDAFGAQTWQDVKRGNDSLEYRNTHPNPNPNPNPNWRQ